MRRSTPDAGKGRIRVPRPNRDTGAAGPSQDGLPRSSKAIHRDLMTLAGLPGQGRIRTIYGLPDRFDSPRQA